MSKLKEKCVNLHIKLFYGRLQSFFNILLINTFMNKTTLKVLVLALAVLFPMQNVFAEYCTNFGNSSHAARYLNAFTLTDGTNEAVVSSICTSTGQAVYHDKTSVVLETEAGATISFSSITWNGEWMHGYAFADFNNDGTFDAEDVVSYNFYSATDGASGQNSKGETVQNNCNVTAANMPEWTIPATLAPGDYRFRFKIDWNNLDPCGASDIAGNGGAVVDVTIRIASQAAARTISVSASPAEAGTVTINGEEVASVTAEGGITLVATPAAGYKFVNWTVNGEEVSTKATYIDGTEGDKTYVANFVAKELVSLSVSVNDATMGSAVSSVEGETLEGTDITLMATANEGYEFVNWTVNGEVVSEEATFVTTVTASTEFVANFQVKLNKLVATSASISMTAWGSYTEDNIIDGNYNTNYESLSSQKDNETVTLSFEGLSVIDKVVIKFKASSIPVQSKLQVSTDGLTWSDIEGSTFTSGDIDADGFITVNCNKAIGSKVRMVIETSRSAYLIIYEFEVYGESYSISSRTISVSVNDEAMGTAYIGEEGTTTAADQTGVVKLIAVANEGYEFVNWTVNGEEVGTNAIIDDTTEGDKEYVANFVALAVYNVGVSVNNSMMGTATASNSGEIVKYTEITLTATANEGYEFVNWTVGEEVVSEEVTFVTAVTSSVEYVANFRLIPEKVIPVSASSNKQPYNEESYKYSNVIDGNYNTYFYAYPAESGDYVTLTLENETPLCEVKIFLASSYAYHPNAGKLQVSTDNETWTDVEGCGFVYADIETEDGKAVITLDTKGVNAKYVRVVLEDFYYYEMIYMSEIELYEAAVEVAPRTISVSVNDTTMGSAYVGIEGTTELTEQTSAVRMVATPSNNAYRFVNWTVNGEEVATTPKFVDRTEGDKAYVANFEAKPIYTVSVASATAKRGSASCDAAEVVYEGDVVTFTATPADGY